MTHDGYFPPGSMLRRVQRERAVGLLYGQRALAIGALDPRNFIGTLRHTRFPDRPFQRLAATAKMFETVFFGSRAEADRVLAVVDRMHAGVRGELPQDAGATPAGTPYSAHDPELMLWTVAVSAHSAHYFHELLVGRLSPAEADDLWRDWIRFAELFGMPRAVAPRSWAEFREYFNAKLASPESHLTDEARHIGTAVMFEIPTPEWQWPAMRVHNLILRGSLPPRVRELYRLDWKPVHAAAHRAAVLAHRASRPLTPGAVLRGRNTAHFERVAATERALIAAGRPAPGSLSPAAS